MGNYTLSGIPAGNYLMDFQANGYISVLSRAVTVNAGAQTQANLSMSEALTTGTMRITLTWTNPMQGAVRDVDSYLAIPGVTNPLGFPYKGQSYYGATLDHDEINWVGPETITINTLSNSTYTYYVNNYSDRSSMTALGNSLVDITVYSGNNVLKEYKIPAGGNGRTFKVFQITAGVLVDVMQYDDTTPVYTEYRSGGVTLSGL